MTHKRIITETIKYIILTVFAILFVAPLVWMIVNSMKTENNIFKDMTSLVTFLPARNPSEWFSAYSKLFDRFNIIRPVINSLAYASITVISSLIVNSMAGYALSRYNFPLKNLILTGIIALLIVPLENTTIPLFTIIHRLKLTNTYAGLILPSITNVFVIYLFKQFFDTIPKEYEEAGQIDGASTAKIFVKVIVPLSKPIYATAAVMTFIWSWNDYVWPLMVMTDDKKYPIQVAINVIFNTQPVFTDQIMAALTIATIPMIIIYATMQKYVTQGLAGVGIK